MVELKEVGVSSSRDRWWEGLQLFLCASLAHARERLAFEMKSPVAEAD